MSSTTNQAPADKRVLHPLHAVIATFYPALYLNSNNVGETPLEQLALALAACGIAGIVLWLLLSIELKNRNGKGLVYTLLVFPVLMHGYLFRETREIRYQLEIPALFYIRLEILLLVCGVFFLYWIYRRVRKGEAFPRTTVFLNASFAVMLVLVLYNTGSNAAAVWRVSEADSVAASAVNDELAERMETPESTPNIYLILLDGYGGADLLQSSYGHDNDPFLKGLEERGFYVARKAKANYPYTILSLTSMLEMDYVLESDSTDAEGPYEFAFTSLSEYRFQKRLRNSTVVNALRRFGYEYVSFRSGFNATADIGTDRIFRRGAEMSEFARTMLYNSALVPALRAAGVPVDEYLFRRGHRGRINFILDNVHLAPSGTQPAFVFAHVVAPHPPFLFFDDGTPRPSDGAEESESEFPAAYAGYLRYVNDRALDAIDRIKAADPGAVIVVCGDHGPRNEFTQESGAWDDYALDWLSTMTAFHFPDPDGYKQLYPQISQVNMFRAVFNHCFNAKLELLPEKSLLPLRDDDGKLIRVEWDGDQPIRTSDLE